MGEPTPPPRGLLIAGINFFVTGSAFSVGGPLSIVLYAQIVTEKIVIARL